ncbi:MAG: hypothetical protein PVS2B2_27010 [Candidatus Acidiferrum sp.]
MSTGGSVNGTGGSSGPNTANAKSQGTTGSHMGATESTSADTNAGANPNASNMSIQPNAPTSANFTPPASAAQK